MTFRDFAFLTAGALASAFMPTAWAVLYLNPWLAVPLALLTVLSIWVPGRSADIRALAPPATPAPGSSDQVAS